MAKDKFLKGKIIIYKTAEGPQLDVKLDKAKCKYCIIEFLN